ncbi:conserved hypothetical protein [uncultured Spirochaetota bacterium]|jgi:hypothetical protein|nr:conserved hypothetical protein [uncultured Spirochaetota bacterium]
MKVKPSDREAFSRMAPGVLTAGGFLGTDTRPPEEIIAEDEAAFARLGLDFDQVARELAQLAEEGSKGLGEPIKVRNLLVQAGDARGMLPCPWNDGLFHKTAVSLRPADLPPGACVESEDMLVYSELSIHLLKVHHFCQGLGSPFRLAPELIAELLEK